MATISASNRTLVVFGSETAMMTGSLVYKCGGIDMLTLEKLERKGVRTYDGAVREIKQMNEELYFYIPKHKVVVTDQISSADGLLLVVTSHNVSEQFAINSIVDQLKESATLFAQNKAVILIDMLNTNDATETVFNHSVQIVKEKLQELGISAQSTPVIPISSSKGDNFIESSPKSTWYSKPTLLATLNELFA